MICFWKKIMGVEDIANGGGKWEWASMGAFGLGEE